MPMSFMAKAGRSSEAERQFELAANESVTVTGMRRRVGVGRVGGVSGRMRLSEEGDT